CARYSAGTVIFDFW
nr:immunoglobulin heavy chain junction region [Macaca mulatta]